MLGVLRVLEAFKQTDRIYTGIRMNPIFRG